jgi:hypothetical protein
MTPLAIILWGCVKSAMYGSNGQMPNSDQLKQQITAATTTVISETMRNVWAEISYTLHISRHESKTSGNVMTNLS